MLQPQRHDAGRRQRFLERQHRDAVAVIGDGGGGDRILDREAVAMRDQDRGSVPASAT